MFDNVPAFRKALAGGGGVGVTPVEVYTVNAGQTTVIPMPSPSVTKAVFTVGTNSLLTIISYIAPDGSIFGDIGAVLDVELLPTSAGLQVTNNEAGQLTINMWRL